MIYSKPIAVVDGLRTPIAKADTHFSDIEADDLAAFLMHELLVRTGLKSQIDEVIVGNVAQPVHAQNVARVAALKAGLDISIPAFTVHRNCASGIESITTGANKIALGELETVLAAGVESMSNIPVLYSKPMKSWLWQLMKSRKTLDKLTTLLQFRPKLLKPVLALQLGLTDPICNQIMGQTAENLAEEFAISRHEQDMFSLRSHQKAVHAIKSGRYAQEIMPVTIPPKYKKVVEADNGPREEQSIEQLAKLKPFFNKISGSVTVGSSSQISDGAAAVILMNKKKALEEGHKVLGYITGYAYAGCHPERMGLGPVYASAKLFKQSKLTLADMDVIELNEAFSAQVLANVNAFSSSKFAQEFLNQPHAVGEIDLDKLNINGGAIAIGHPLGMTGTRLVLTTLKQLHLEGKQHGLATLCIGGGQGAAVLLESA